MEALVATAVGKYGRLDVMASAAGINPPDRRIISVAPETWDAVLGTNLTGAFNCTQAVLA